MTYNVFSGTLNPTHFTSRQPSEAADCLQLGPQAPADGDIITSGQSNFTTSLLYMDV